MASSLFHGDGPKTRVVEPDLRAHDHDNLLIVGGVLPQTLNLAVLALRAARTVQHTLHG